MTGCSRPPPVVSAAALLTGALQHMQDEHLQQCWKEFTFTFVCVFPSDDRRMPRMSVRDLTKVTIVLQEVSTESFIAVFSSK